MAQFHSRGNSSLTLSSSVSNINHSGIPIAIMEFRLQIQSQDDTVIFHVPISMIFDEHSSNWVVSSFIPSLEPNDVTLVEPYEEVISSFARTTVYNRSFHDPTEMVVITARFLQGENHNDELAASVSTTIYEINGEEDESTHNCPICFEDFVTGEKIGTTKCNHVYHSRCLGEWMRRKLSCPFCRCEL